MFRKGNGSVCSCEWIKQTFSLSTACTHVHKNTCLTQNWVTVAHIWVESKYRALCVTTGNELPARRDRGHVYFGPRLPPYLHTLHLSPALMLSGLPPLLPLLPPPSPLHSLHFNLLFLTLPSLPKFSCTLGVLRPFSWVTAGPPIPSRF